MTSESQRYVDPTAQLVAEVFVRDIDRSKAFYASLGFTVEIDRGTFVVLTWEDHQFYLEERPDQGPVPPEPQINIRVMVPDVDRYWRIALEREIPVFAPIEDRSYGLRDFTIVDPDGIGLRFGTRLNTGPH
ncbi:MAG: VOC family protein [Thermomicrobiales bacterium]|nr:VOC family protein [Thermomicrobiales bacterium]